MQISVRFSSLGLVVAIALALGAWTLFKKAGTTENATTTGVASERPIEMPTSGGHLEIATVTAYERFTRSSTKEFWGIDLGTTVSQIQAKVVYRYYIHMEKKWPMTLQGKTCIVESPDVKPTLPVAFDTETVDTYSRSGWARFDKQASLTELQRSLTGELTVRAGSESYRQLARDAGRKVIEGFVRTWLLKEHGWQRSPEYSVVVLFPGEKHVKTAGAQP